MLARSDNRAAVTVAHIGNRMIRHVEMNEILFLFVDTVELENTLARSFDDLEFAMN